MTLETYIERKQSQYEFYKNKLDEVFSKGGIPNIPAIKKQIRDMKTKLKRLENTYAFAPNGEVLDKLDYQISGLRGKLQAFEERMKWIRTKLAEA